MRAAICKDDADGASTSKVELTLSQGQRIVIVVSNYDVEGSSRTGGYVLNITQSNGF